MKQDSTLPEVLNRAQRIGLIAGAAGMLLSAVGYFAAREAFLSAYLISFLFWLGLTLGCMPIVFLHFLTGGQWGYPVRRPLETVTQTLPLFALLFLPIALNLKGLYLWADPQAVAHDALLRAKAPYLNVAFFMARAAGYFVLWILLSSLLNKFSLDFDRKPKKSLHNKQQLLGGLGLITYGLTVSFASVDWAMSLEPHWYSTIYGLLFMIGQVVAALAFVIWFVTAFADQCPFSRVLTPARAHDLGNLLFAFVLLWAYISLSQFIIIWAGNLPEETPWYLRRFNGGWNVLAVALVLFHFFIPFFLLLIRRLKKSFEALGMIAALLIFMRWVDLFWLIRPVSDAVTAFHWVDVAAFAGIGGFWVYLFSMAASRQALILQQDPIHKMAETAH